MSIVKTKQKDTKMLKNDTHQETDWLSLCEINQHTNLPQIMPSVVINDETWICTQGELMQVSGQKKSGKSNVVKYLMATALMKEVDTMNTLGIRATFTEKLVVFVDTEQSKQKTKEFVNRVWQIADLKSQPNNLKFFNIRSLSMNQKLSFLEQFFEKRGKETSLLVIDGITDFIDSVNNEEVSKKLIDSLLRQLGGDLSIVVTIHEGKDGNGARGHIGQEIERKCVGAISVSKDRKKRIHKISCKLIRSHADFEDIFFHFDDKIGDFKRLEENEEKAISDNIRTKTNDDLKVLFQMVFLKRKPLNKKAIIEGILNCGLGIDKNIQVESQKRKAKRMIEKALSYNIICVNSKEEYELN